MDPAAQCLEVDSELVIDSTDHSPPGGGILLEEVQDHPGRSFSEFVGVLVGCSHEGEVLSVLELSRATYRKMRQNLGWAAGYNLLSVPLAAGVLAPVGFILPMSVGAILMSLSTIVVALNAQLLRRLDLDPDRWRDVHADAVAAGAGRADHVGDDHSS